MKASWLSTVIFLVVGGCTLAPAIEADAGAGGGTATGGGTAVGGGTGGGEGDAGEGDAGESDAGERDAGQSDGGERDAGDVDAGQIDAGDVDAGMIDAGLIDAGELDAGSADAGELDAGPADAGALDAGAPDAGQTCAGRDGAACEYGASLRGLCRAGACGPCAGPGDDMTCTAAWGSVTSRQLCQSGQCSAGECRADDDCASVGKAGQICGLSAPNQCSTCTADDQCKAASYGANTICNTSVGLCVPNTCSTPNTACAANANDFCCGTVCVAGNCCSTAQCAGGSICLNNSCTSCPAVTNNTFYVDPVAGADTGTTGAATCAFKSVSRAVQYISGTFGAAIPAGTRVLLRGNLSVATGEQFPIRVPSNVIVESEIATSPRTILVPANTTGFALASPSSGLRWLTLEGANVGGVGVRLEAGSTPTQTSTGSATTLTNVTVQNFVGDGIRVEGGGVDIGPGVVATGNGSSSNGGAGLHVTGGTAVVNVQAGQTPTRFEQNRGNGILVDAVGRLTLTGVPDLSGYPANQNPPAVASGSGTVSANRNTLANVAISQVGTNLPLCQLNGVVAWNGEGNGINIGAGSNVVIRNSVSAKNRNSGVQLSPVSTAGITNIDLGSSASPGRNVFQAPVNGNTRAGICVGNFFNFNLTLKANGNYFANKSCVTLTSPVTVLATSYAGCANANGLDVAVDTTGASNSQQTNVHVTLDACQNL